MEGGAGGSSSGGGVSLLGGVQVYEAALELYDRRDPQQLMASSVVVTVMESGVSVRAAAATLLLVVVVVWMVEEVVRCYGIMHSAPHGRRLVHYCYALPLYYLLRIRGQATSVGTIAILLLLLHFIVHTGQ